MAAEKRGRPSTCGFSMLPEECISYLLSFTSPCDICRSSLVSKSFFAAAQSDLLWESFLPPDIAEILSRATHPVEDSSGKELYFRLCQPLLVDEGKLSFQLDRSTGKQTYMLSPETMQIIWMDHPQYWKWISLPDSRYQIGILELGDSVDCCYLTP